MRSLGLIIGALGPACDTSIGVCDYTDCATTAGMTRTGAFFPIAIAGNERLVRVDCGGLGEAPRTSALNRSAPVPPADLHIPILGQLASAQLPLGDALEPGPLEVVGFDTFPGGGHPAQPADRTERR